MPLPGPRAACPEKESDDVTGRRVLAWGGLLAAGVMAALAASMPAADGGARTATTRPAYPSTDRYDRRSVEGWTVYVQKDLTSDTPELARDALRLLEVKLYEIVRCMPPKALAELRKIPIWMSVRDVHGRHPCACYHPDKGWLKDNGYNADMAGAVEISNASTFLKWSHAQPSMVLHELAHGYHHRVLGHHNARVRAAFKRAAEGKSYESVLQYGGRTTRHYALNNDQEYFAELTEAYFGTNDYYPFIRPELKQHDPEGYKMIQETYEVQR